MALPVSVSSSQRTLRHTNGLSYRCYVWFQNPKAQIFGMFAVLAIFYSGIGRLILRVVATPAFVYVETLGAILGNPSLREVFAL